MAFRTTVFGPFKIGGGLQGPGTPSCVFDPVSDTATIGAPFTLTGQDGTKRSSADFRGRYMLIYFDYSYCPDVCSTRWPRWG